MVRQAYHERLNLMAVSRVGYVGLMKPSWANDSSYPATRAFGTNRRGVRLTTTRTDVRSISLSAV